MTEEEKAAWDEEWEAEGKKREEWEGELKTLIGFDDCNADCQAKFTADLKDFYSGRYTTCKEDDSAGVKTSACVNADALFKKEIEARAGDKGDDEKKNYYSEMSDEERNEFKEAFKE